MSVKQVLTQLIRRYEALQEPIGWPELPWEAEWKSECLIMPRGIIDEPKEGEELPWRPVEMQQAPDMFNRLSEALETPIHPDLVNYYSTYWSDPIYAQHPEGELSLLFVWNDQEFERLRANLIGHALAKKRMRQPLTLFFACTEPEAAEFISIMNDDGSIWLEAPGKKPLRQLAKDLKSFIEELEPLVHPSRR